MKLLIRCVTAYVLLSAHQPAFARNWNCALGEQVIALNAKSVAIISAARDADPEIAIATLEKLRDETPPAKRSAVQDEIININLKHKRIDAAADAYRYLFNMTEAATPARERARGDLAALLLQKGSARDIIALYEYPDRPVCRHSSQGAQYALASAFNAVGEYQRAEKILEAVKGKAPAKNGGAVYMPDLWSLLKLRLDCNQRRFPACADDYNSLLRAPLRTEALSQQLTLLLPIMRRFPELNEVLAAAERDGIIAANHVVPTKVELTELMPALRTPPQYPRNASNARITGFVDLYIEIDEQGIPDAVSVARAEPPGVFDQAAIDAVWKWRFQPKVVDGIPRRHAGYQKINFSIAN